MKKLGKHGGRLILRNLPFSITEAYLRSVLEKIGKLKELSIPIEQSKGRNKGFAFVEFEKKNISEKAIKILNGKKIQSREISVDYALSKEKYVSTLKSEEISKDFKHKQIQEPVEEKEPDEEIEEEEVQEIKKNKKNTEKIDNKPRVMNFDEGKVLFVMNLNYETQEENMEELFNTFGKVKYIKIVLNKETGESRGTAFVCYKTNEDAEKVIKISEEEGIELDERKLKIVKAVSREAAVNLKSAKPEKTDKRNLHLAKLSLIMPGTEEFKSLTPKEIELRTLAAKKLKDKLLNPNVMVSSTRLLFKNIPKSLNENDLKTLIKKIITTADPSIINQKLFNQVKIIKETERFDKNGNHLSKGFAFIEFKKHDFALIAMKECNGNSKYFGEKHKPIVEFALEDHRILRIRKLKLSRQKKHLKEIQQSSKETGEKKMSRGKKQRLKRRMMKDLNEIEQ